MQDRKERKECFPSLWIQWAQFRSRMCAQCESLLVISVHRALPNKGWMVGLSEMSSTLIECKTHWRVLISKRNLDLNWTETAFLSEKLFVWSFSSPPSISMRRLLPCTFMDGYGWLMTRCYVGNMINFSRRGSGLKNLTHLACISAH